MVKTAYIDLKPTSVTSYTVEPSVGRQVSFTFQGAAYSERLEGGDTRVY